MNNIYTEVFFEAFAESHPYEYKQKYTSKKGKHRSLIKDSYSNETSFTKKAKSGHNSDYKQARKLKRFTDEL